MNNDLLYKQKLLQDFQTKLDGLIEFFNRYPEDYLDFQRELAKVCKQNKINLRYIEQTNCVE